MKTFLSVNGCVYALDDLVSASRTIVTVGKESDEAYNVVATGAAGELFQCQLTRSGDGWLLQNGQWRTECPRGIRSRLQHACQMCQGRCVNLRTARPNYYWRFPETATLLNGDPLPAEGTIIKDGDLISFQDTVIAVLQEHA